MSTTLPLTLEQFHALYDDAKPAYEYWRGTPIQKTMPTTLHGLVQSIVWLLLERAGWIAAPEVRLKVSPEIEPVPDLIASREPLETPYPTKAPALCVEVLSPGDTLKEMLEKAWLYISWGTRTVWIVDPEKRHGWTVTAERVRSSDETLQAGETVIALTALFGEVERRLQK